MITFEELHKRIQKQYPAALKAAVLGENIFPLYIRANKSPEKDFAERNRTLEALYLHSSHHHPYGYHIETEQVHRRQHGLQDEPVAFYFDTAERFLGYLEKEKEYALCRADARMVLHSFPVLKEWLASHVAELIQYHGRWPKLIQVLHYFCEHPRPAIFARELPVKGMGTKFVEQHKSILYALLNLVLPPQAIDQSYTGLAQFEQRFGLRTDAPRVRVRWLDNGLANRYTGGLTDISLSVHDLAAQAWTVKRVLVVENKTSLLRADIFLTLPQIPGTIALFGSGRAASLLAAVPWLSEADLFYWGDIDAEGFEILDHFMSIFSHTHPLCMDMETLEYYRSEWVKGSGAQEKNLVHLPQSILPVYHRVVSHNIRLEQEQVHPQWVREKWV